MNDICTKAFQERFGTHDKNCTYIVNLIELSCLNFNRIQNGENYKKIDGKYIYKLWHLNKHQYQRFISNMIGQILGLYDFSHEISVLMKNKVNNISTSEIVSDLNKKGYHILNKKLSEDKCLQIKKNVLDKNFCPYNSKIKIKGNTILGRQQVIDNASTFWISRQDDVFSIPEVKELVTDPFLLNIIQKYLGCNPILCQTNLWYSCKGNKIERTQHFHQDYDDINFLKIFIYLSNVDESSGAHSYISTSINNIIEPPGYQPSTRLTDTFAKNTYGDKIKLFIGDIGTIIIENTNGFHRGMPIIKGNRLMLQLQYSTTLFPFQQGIQFSNLEKNDFMKKYALCYLKYK